MDGQTRRKEILKCIADSEKPVSGTKLAEMFQVSRQVIVQDIALLRAADCEIISTNRGYVCSGKSKAERVLYAYHTDDKMEEELNIVVDCGGTVEDVFVRHKVYGELRAVLNIRSRMQVRQFLENIKNGKSKPLTDITSGYHYHTITAESEEVLDMIESALKQAGICGESIEKM